jgi:hypothetical protein
MPFHPGAARIGVVIEVGIQSAKSPQEARNSPTTANGVQRENRRSGA